jgi:hypothetical protein
MPREIPKNLTETIATCKTIIGGISAAELINQAPVETKPTALNIVAADKTIAQYVLI